MAWVQLTCTSWRLWRSQGSLTQGVRQEHSDQPRRARRIWACQQWSHPANNEAHYEAHNEANNLANNQANNDAHNEAYNQANNEAPHQANNEANDETINQANCQAYNKTHDETHRATGRVWLREGGGGNYLMFLLKNYY